jgi:Uncharacterized enzyme of heme biosynthesis
LNINHTPSLHELLYCFLIFLSDDLLVQFFEFFSEKFKSDANVYSIHTLEPVQRHQLHLELERTPLIVQDPFKRSHNVAQNVTDSGLRSIQEVFERTYQRLKNIEGDLSLLDVLVKIEIKSKKSQIYTVALPECRHRTGADITPRRTIDCFSSVKMLFTDDLEMEIVEDIDTSHSNEIEASDIKLENGKRKLGPNDNDINLSKKPKLELDSIQFTAVAYQRTWISRRKQKRQLAQQKMGSPSGTPNGNTGNCDDNKAPRDKEETDPETIESCETSTSKIDGVEMKTVPPSSDVVCNKDNIQVIDKPILLSVRMHIIKSADGKEVCKFTLSLLQGDVNDYQTFYAYFKKKIVNHFK